ncbi:MAG: dNTP triphosphohydrolase [Calditrichaeota bacterium]|nr:MAG: dNTP triphosphohydrolase [Calditrichota bacterium]
MNSITITLRNRRQLDRLENKWLSPFAAKSDAGASTRLRHEKEHPYRTAFQRDRDRIIHSRAFRRLKHKRQIFLTTFGDHYRTRLTHTIEVSQLSRTMARTLGLNEDLVEAIALAHDIGHTPFGHIGEVVLHRIMAGKDHLDGVIHLGDMGGFKHNYQSVRIVDSLETKYSFDGLNLTAPVREGILKHTRLRRQDVLLPGFCYDGLNYDLDDAVTLEGQIVAICDEIAQRTHDLEDGIRAQYVDLDQVRQLALIKKIEEIKGSFLSSESDGFVYRNRLIRKLVDLLVTDVLRQTIKNLRQFYKREQRYSFFDRRIVWFSDQLDPLQVELDQFIMKRIIKTAIRDRDDHHSEEVIRNLFKSYFQNPNLVPSYRLEKCMSKDEISLVYDQQAAAENRVHEQLRRDGRFARAVCDYIAGMTDHYAELKYREFSAKSVQELEAMRGDDDRVIT